MNQQPPKIFSWLETITNLIQLNILWILFCLPVVTIFPATAAMYSVVRQWIVEQDPSVYRSFLFHFKKNMKKNTIIGLMWYVVLCLLYINFFAIFNFETAQPFFMVLFIAFTSWFISFTLWLWSILSHFRWSIPILIKNTILLTIGRLPTTFLLLIISLISGAIVYSFPLSLFIIVSAHSYISFLLCYKTLAALEQA